MKLQEKYRVTDLATGEQFDCEYLEELLASIYYICYAATSTDTVENHKRTATRTAGEQLFSGNGGTYYKIETVPKAIIWEDLR